MLGLGLLMMIGGAAASTQDAARERLEALVEKTNALEHFHAEFGFEMEGESTSVSIDYLYPDSMRLGMDVGEGATVAVCSEGQMWSSTKGAGSDESFGHLDLFDRDGPCKAAIEVLRGGFWHADSGPALSLGCRWRVNGDTGKTDFEFSILPTPPPLGAGTKLLGWLTTMTKLEGDLALEDGELVHRSERATARVDAETGFLKELTLAGQDGKSMHVELRALDVDAVPDPGLFEALEPSQDSRDVSSGMQEWATAR